MDLLARRSKSEANGDDGVAVVSDDDIMEYISWNCVTFAESTLYVYASDAGDCARTHR